MQIWVFLSVLIASNIFLPVLSQDNCTDIQPNGEYTCEDQKQFGKCSAPWMTTGNFCAKTCQFCGDGFQCGLEGSCIYGVCSTSRCAEGNCFARQSNIQGEVLILDYNSLSYHGGPNHPPEVTNPAGCCDKCKTTQGCNAWVFCSNEDGCGEGCDRYVQALADPSSGYLSYSRGSVAPVPFVNFGQFGGCQGTKWPWMLCTLKTVPDVEDPVEDPSGMNEWVSGVLKPEPGCADGISFSVCSACKGTTDMTYCQQCASKVPLNEQLLCPVCTDRIKTVSLHDHCTDCLDAEGGSTNGCGQCAMLQNFVEDCFECTADAENVETENGCYNCFYQTSAESEDCVQECVKASETPEHAKAECGDCYTTEDPQRCTQCLQESLEANTYCTSCSTEECYTCLSNFGDNEQGRKGCASCEYDDGQAATDCYECAQDENVPDFAKQACGQCSDGDTSDSRKACYGCLQSIQSEAAGSSCSMCQSLSQGSTERCYECVGQLSGRGSNGASCWQCAFEDSVEDRTACYACTEDQGKPSEVADLCHMCFGSWVADSKACTACMATKSTAEEASDCY